MPEELWKTVPGHENYEVSSLGKFVSIARYNERGHWMRQRYLIPKRNKDGYLTVRLSGKEYLAHRMVALAFHGYSELPQVNHMNGVKDDNRVDNLEWCSISHNVRHAIDTGLIVYTTGLDARVSKGWIQAEKEGFGLMLRGKQDLLAVGMNPSTVSSCLMGRRRQHRGFTISRITSPL
ncbi:NUMOD4 motif protein [compost metagenome]